MKSPPKWRQRQRILLNHIPMYHKNAINLADELTTFVTAETNTKISAESISMTKIEVEDVFLFLLKDLFLCEEHSLKKTAKVGADLGLDSLDLVELVMNCEREFGISLQDSEWIRLSTVGEWMDMLAEKLTTGPMG